MEISNFFELSMLIEKQRSTVSNTDSVDMFYIIQILQRKKDNPDLKGDSKVVKEIIVHNCLELVTKQAEIMDLCAKFNARAYFWPTPRSYKATTITMLESLATAFKHETYHTSRHCFSKAAGQDSSRFKNSDKIWVIDLDYDDPNYFFKITELISSEFFISSLNTPNGLHILAKPHDLRNVSYSDDVKKNNPTLLYFLNKG